MYKNQNTKDTHRKPTGKSFTEVTGTESILLAIQLQNIITHAKINVNVMYRK